jgi:hypothetical protein
MRRLESDPTLRALMQVPLFGTLVCRMEEPGSGPAIGQTEFLNQYVRELIHQSYRGSDSPDVIATLAVRVLAHLAFTTYRSSPWVVEVETLQRVIETGPARTARESVLAVQRILTHDFPLFVLAGTGRLQIQHQVFADFLYARWVAEELAARQSGREAWLREQVAADLSAGREEVWRHLAGLVDDREPLLRALLGRHRRDRLRRLVPWGRPRVPVALCLAGYCLAAAPRKGRESRTGRRVLAALVRRWKQGADFPLMPVHARRPKLNPGDAVQDAVREIAKAGPVDFAVQALRDPDGNVRQRAVDVLGATGPTAAVWTGHIAAVVHDRRVPFPKGDWILYVVAGCLCGIVLDLSAKILARESLGWVDAFFLVGCIAIIGVILWECVWSKVQVTARHFRRHAAWLARQYAAEVLGGLGPTASSAVGDLAQAVRHDPSLTEAAQALTRVGPAGRAELARLLRDPNPEVRKVAAEAWNTMADRPCPAEAAAAPDRPPPPPLAAPRRQLPVWVKIAATLLVGIFAGVLFMDAEGVLSLVKPQGYYDGHSVGYWVRQAKGGNPGDRSRALFVLRKIAAREPATAIGALVAAFGDEDEEVRANACNIVLLLGRDAVPFLEKASTDVNPRVRQSATLILRVLRSGQRTPNSSPRRPPR